MHLYTKAFPLLFPLFILFTIPGYAQETADLILRNGKLVTMDENRPLAEALAVKGDRIIAVGTNQAIHPHKGPNTKIIDLKGKLAIPGFIEGHAHFLGIGTAKMQIDLNSINNWDDAIAIVKKAVQKASPGEWITGRGWHQEKWDRTPKQNVEGYPCHDSLSAISPEHPVFLIHASGHLSFANAKAMQLAGITSKTQSPSGGEILKDKQGNPIGVFRETAQSLVRNAYNKHRARMTAEEIRKETRRKIELAANDCLSKGITSFHDAGSSFETIGLFKQLAEENKLKLRLWVMVGESNQRLREKLSHYRIIGAGNHFLTVRAIKRFMDGALGAQGAWLLEPYNDLPTSTGLNTESPEDILETARIAIANGFQLCTHAIGDRANREVLDIYEKVFKENPGKSDLRWRIEHAQHLHPNDITRFGQLGVIASMQSCHCTSDAPYVITRLGTQRAEEGAYVWRSLLDTGAKIANGTDAPVENTDPIANYYAAVTRCLKDGSTFYPGQCMTREEALRSYTIDAAYAAFEDTIKGSLTPGKLADITVLSRDILTIPVNSMKDTKVLYTIVGGRIMYSQ